jgi:mycothiol system anti-sigma-R factor
MSHGCNNAVEHLYQYLDEELTWSRRVRVRWHLRRCTNCDGAFDFEARLKVVIRERSGEDAPPELLDRLRALIREETKDGTEA